MEPVLYLAALGGLYALVYYLNHKTPVPAGCESIRAACDGCAIGSCGNHPSQQEFKEEQHV
ncbi:MAG: hypothetical protein JXK92_04680 [Erysipelotrichaceae bacterium]|nr:hypothetical protein [Erysipelotrichaceae bacterium]